MATPLLTIHPLSPALRNSPTIPDSTMSPSDESTLVAQLSKLAKDEQYRSKTKIESWATIERDIVVLTKPKKTGLPVSVKNFGLSVESA